MENIKEASTDRVELPLRQNLLVLTLDEGTVMEIVAEFGPCPLQLAACLNPYFI